MNRYASERKSSASRCATSGGFSGTSPSRTRSTWRAAPTPTGRRRSSSCCTGHRLDSDGVKLYCATMAKNVADRAIQVLGGYGYVGEYRVERLWRDAKLLEIGGGTLEAHQKNMTRELRRHRQAPLSERPSPMARKRYWLVKSEPFKYPGRSS